MRASAPSTRNDDGIAAMTHSDASLTGLITGGRLSLDGLITHRTEAMDAADASTEPSPNTFPLFGASPATQCQELTLY